MKNIILSLLILASYSSVACEKYLRKLPSETYFKKYDHILEGVRPKLTGNITEEISKENHKLWLSRVSKITESTPQSKVDEAIAAYDEMTKAINAKAKDGEGYFVVPMQPRYHGENKFAKFYDTQVKYFDEVERAQFKVTIKDGIFYNAQGELLSTGDRGAIFVMDHSGDIYVVPTSWKTGDFSIHHPSALGGMPVASAGEMFIVKGKLVRISDKSGHYGPPGFFIKQAKAEMASQKVDIDKVKFDSWSSPGTEQEAYARSLGAEF